MKRAGSLPRNAASPRLARPHGRTMCCLRGSMRRSTPRRLTLRRSAALQALLERIHQADDVAGLFFRLDGLDRFTGGLAPDQRFQGVFVFILEFRGVEMRGLGVEDMAGEFDHVFGNFRALDV